MTAKAAKKKGSVYRPRSVAVDLDGTLAQYDGWKGAEHIGQPFKGAVQFTKALKQAGFHIIIHTARTCEANAYQGKSARIARRWLKDHGFKFDEVWTGVGKPIACAYVDDRAVQCTAQLYGPAHYNFVLARIMALAGEEK